MRQITLTDAQIKAVRNALLTENYSYEYVDGSEWDDCCECWESDERGYASAEIDIPEVDGLEFTVIAKATCNNDEDEKLVEVEIEKLFAYDDGEEVEISNPTAVNIEGLIW